MQPIEDTIAAIATPPGEGGIAVVRLSGPAAGPVIGRVLRDRAGGGVALAPRVATVAYAADP
ncbi:MAG: hypothetical protein ACYDA8_07415, partial [Deferrisomatales bacterium]